MDSRNDCRMMQLNAISVEYYLMSSTIFNSGMMYLLCIMINYDLFRLEWSVAPSIFNIKAQGLAHCFRVPACKTSFFLEFRVNKN